MPSLTYHLDIRKASSGAKCKPAGPARTMELALSERSLKAIEDSCSLPLLEAVKKVTMSLRGRMVHERDPILGFTEHEQTYDIHGRCLLAVDRANLTSLLLDELERLPNVSLHFQHKITAVNFEHQKVLVEGERPLRQKCSHQGPTFQDHTEYPFDLLLGCDGAHSVVRASMMKSARIDFAQTWLDLMWCQFTIPPVTKDSYTSPSARDGFATSPNHLHIWPHDEMMFMAIPSVDKNILGTFFGPTSVFARLESDPSQIEQFFDQNFPGAGELIGRSDLRRQFGQNAHEALINIKCCPHVYKSCGAILGDAAHAMAPFYGQGVNAGLEDVRVLFHHLDMHLSAPSGLRYALQCYNAERVSDAHAINDLALANYWEMRAGVRSRLYLVRKSVEEFIARIAPSTGFVTQYSRVSFSNQRYSEIAGAVANQHAILGGLLATMCIPFVTFVIWLTWRIMLSRAITYLAS